MSESDQWLEAGGLVPVDAPLGGDLPSDTVDARGYHHPALAGRVIVRLVPDAIARGVDTEMGLLGFALSTHADDIARQRRRTLGFPGTALVIDPERARYALEVMREFKKHAKRISSKPGHAKEGFDEIALRLSRQVPHFLPSYWEEVARSFATEANLNFAGQSFDKARTAEREFGLQVDEERRGEAFLEFALLGALTVKSLQSYGKELARLSGPGPAYDRMFTLAVRRTLGGVPPWASLPKDLRSLAKAAKRDVAAEDERLLREVLTAGSLQRAPASFWTEYRDAWTRLAQDDPAVRARLLDLFPSGGKARYSWRKDESGFDDAWMEQLVGNGSLPTLWDASAPAEAVPAGGRAAWLRRLQEWAQPGDGWTLQIVRRAADVLRADGVPIKVRAGDWYKPLDLDLVELLLELDLPWAFEPGAAGRVQLDKWSAHAPAPARAGFPGEVRPRDPARASTHPDIAPHLVQAVDAVYGDARFEAVAAGMKGLATVRRRWLEERVADLTRTGLATAAVGLARLEGATSADHFAEFPEVGPALAEAAIARSLARTMSLGLFEELSWPAWDQAQVALGLDKLERCHLHRQMPHLVVATNRKLWVLGRDGVELEHDLKHGHGDDHPLATLVVGGEVLVQWSYWANGEMAQTAYWTGAPNDTFDGEGRWQTALATPLELGDSVIYGATKVTRRDRVGPPGLQHQAHDATSSWVLDEHELRIQDRASGKALEQGRPAFLEGLAVNTADWAYYRVDGPHSPLGVVDGQYGTRLLRPPVGETAPAVDDDEPTEPVTALTLETLAGERWTGPIRLGNTEHVPLAMVRWPGADRARPVHELANAWRKPHDPQVLVGDPDGPQVALAQTDTLRMATAGLPPLAFWHFLKPVDEVGSQRLRRIDEADAARLLTAARAEDAGALDAALREVLPEVTAERLKEGLRHVARIAADLERRLEKVREARKGGKVHRAAVVDVADDTLLPSVAHLRRYWSWGGAPPATAALRTLGRFLVEGETGETIVHSRLEVFDWIGRIRAVCWGAARSGPTDLDRRAFAAFARCWAESGLAEDGLVRAGQLSIETLGHAWIGTTTTEGVVKPSQSWRHDGGPEQRRLFVWGMDGEGPWSGSFVERCAAVEDLPGATLVNARVARLEGDRAWLLAFADELERRGPRLPSIEAMERLAEAVGISRTEAALVLEGLPEQLDKETREAYGLKQAEVKAAATRLHGEPVEVKLELFAALANDDPTSVWHTDVDGLARAWLARHGRSVAVDDAVVTRADRELSGGGQVVKWFANPSTWAALEKDVTWALDDDGVPKTEGQGFTSDTARKVVGGAAWIASRLPVGDPLRSAVPGVVATAARRVQSPDLWIHGLTLYLHDERTKKGAEAMFGALPTAAEVVTRDDAGEARITRKRLGPVTITHSGWRMNVAWQQAGLDAHARELVSGFARVAEQEPEALLALDALGSPPFQRLLERIDHTPVPPGAWEQDPSRSSPELVAEVARVESLSAEAATLWLQLLTLLDPTKKSCLEWNGWTPATYARAIGELVGRGLVVEGKRARAGRDHFLPGGWVEATGILPYEEWKWPLYGREPRTGAFPVGHPVPLAPLHELFAEAWRRCVDGEGPRFEEVRR